MSAASGAILGILSVSDINKLPELIPLDKAYGNAFEDENRTFILDTAGPDCITSLAIKFYDGHLLPSQLVWISYWNMQIPVSILLSARVINGVTVHFAMLNELADAFWPTCSIFAKETFTAINGSVVFAKIERCFAIGRYFNRKSHNSELFDRPPGIYTTDITGTKYPPVLFHISNISNGDDKVVSPPIVTDLTWDKGTVFDLIVNGLPMIKIKDKLAEGVLCAMNGDKPIFHLGPRAFERLNGWNLRIAPSL